MAKLKVDWVKDFQMQVSVGRHSWAADVAVDKGGGDAGPSPFDHLLGALGTCMCFIARKYAVTSKLPVEGLSAEVEGEWVKAEGGEEVYQIRSRLAVRGKLSESDLKRLARAVETCPVHQAFGGRIRVRMEVGKP